MSFEGRRRSEAGAFPPSSSGMSGSAVLPLWSVDVLCGPQVRPRSSCLFSSLARLPQSGCCRSGLHLGVELLDPMLILCLPF